MDNYFQCYFIYITRSCYLRLTLYGYRETPSCNHFKSYNARSIKPTHYSECKVINNDYNFTSKKGKPLKCVGLDTSEAQTENTRVGINYNYNSIYTNEKK